MTMQRIQEFWLEQTIAEYNSSARTVHLAHWMQHIAMSPDLIRDAIRVADDEMVHAQLCYTAAVDAGYSLALPKDQFSLSLTETSEDLRYSFLNVLVESYCFGETVAVPLFSAMRKDTQQESALAVYDRVLDDEPRHAAFGWLALAWCDEQWSETRGWLETIVPSALLAMKDAYVTDETFDPPLSEMECRWGMMSPTRYNDILFQTAKKTFSNRLGHYDISLDEMLKNW